MIVPKVSVVITTCNRRTLIRGAVRSVLDQYYSNFDLHIVDDASEDNTREAVEPFVNENENTFYWRHEKRRGLSAARNTGISKSTGDYIAFLDDDDEWKPECLEKRIEFLMRLAPHDRENVGVVYCGCEVHILSEGRVTRNMPKIEGNIRANIIRMGLFTIPSSCLFPRTALERIGGYDERLVSSVDHDIWMALAVNGYYAYAVHEPLVIIRETENRRSMVTNMYPRIQGVEQYLSKWSPVFKEWLGEEDALQHVRDYRIRVLGGLAGQKLCERNLRQAWHLIKHIAAQSQYSLTSLVTLSYLVGRCLVRKIIATSIIRRLKHA